MIGDFSQNIARNTRAILTIISLSMVSVFLLFVFLFNVVDEPAQAAMGCEIGGVPCFEKQFNYPSAANASNTGDQTANLGVVTDASGGGSTAISCTVRVGSFSANIVECVVKIVDAVSFIFSRNLGQKITNVVQAMITLVFIIFSISVVFGQQNTSIGPMMLISLKVIFVLFYLNQATVPVAQQNTSFTDQFRQGFFQASLQLSTTMLEAIPNQDGQLGNSRCRIILTTAPIGDDYRIFDFFDCVFKEIIGYRIGIPAFCENAGETKQIPWNSSTITNCTTALRAGWTVVTPAEPTGFNGVMLGIVLAGLFFTGPMGAAIIMLFLGVFFAIIVAMTRSMMLFLTSFIAMAILFGLGPIMVPLILFDNTKQIFKMWMQFIFIYALQPVLLVAFLTILLSALDVVSLELNHLYDIVEEILKGDNAQCEIIQTTNISSYDDSSLSASEKADLDAGVASVENPSSGSWLPSWITSAWTSIVDGVTGTVTAIVESTTNYLYNKMMGLIPKATCLKWAVGEMEVLFANLLVAIFLLFLCVSVVKALPGMLDKLVAPTLVTPINGFSGFADKGMKGVSNRLAGMSSLKDGNSGYSRAAKYMRRK